MAVLLAKQIVYLNARKKDRPGTILVAASQLFQPKK